MNVKTVEADEEDNNNDTNNDDEDSRNRISNVEDELERGREELNNTTVCGQKDKVAIKSHIYITS